MPTKADSTHCLSRRPIFSMMLMLLSFSVHAANFTIDANNAPYSSHQNSTGIGLNSDLAELQNAMFSLIGVHNSTFPSNKIEPGDRITFKWKDGSSQKARILNLFSPSGITPIPGTESKPPNGGLGYTHGPNGNSYGGSNVIGFTPIYGTQTVCVGGYCESITVVTGYQFIYGAGGGPRDQVV